MDCKQFALDDISWHSKHEPEPWAILGPFACLIWFWLESYHLTGKPGLVLFRHISPPFQPFPFGCVFGQCLIVVRVFGRRPFESFCSCISWPWASPLGIVLFFGLAWARHFIEQMDPRPQRLSCAMYLCFSSSIFMAKTASAWTAHRSWAKAPLNLCRVKSCESSNLAVVHGHTLMLWCLSCWLFYIFLHLFTSLTHFDLQMTLGRRLCQDTCRQQLGSVNYRPVFAHPGEDEVEVAKNIKNQNPRISLDLARN